MPPSDASEADTSSPPIGDEPSKPSPLDDGADVADAARDAEKASPSLDSNTGTVGPPLQPRHSVDCPNGVPGLTVYALPPVSGVFTSDGRAVFYSLSGIRAGSADLPVQVWSADQPGTAAVTDVAISGRSVTWGSLGSGLFWNSTLGLGRGFGWAAIIPDSELVSTGLLRIEVIANGQCVYGDVPVLADGPPRPEIQVSPTELPLGPGPAVVDQSGTNLITRDGGAGYGNAIVFWRDVGHYGGERQEGAPYAQPFLPVELTGTAGDAWMYAVNHQPHPTGYEPDGSAPMGLLLVAGSWLHMRIVGTNPVPDIVAADPIVLPLGAVGASVSLTARDAFSSLTQIRVSREGSDGIVVQDACGTYSKNCQAGLPSSLLSREGTLVFTASTTGVGDGSPLTVAIENPTPHVDAITNGYATVLPSADGGTPTSLIVLATREQVLLFSGSGFVVIGDPVQLSYVEEVTTGTRLTTTPPTIDRPTMSGLVPPALVTQIRTLQFRAVNPGTGNGPVLVSNSMPVDVIAAPWIAQVTPPVITAGATGFPISLTGTNLDLRPDLEGVVQLVSPAFRGWETIPTLRSSTSWSFAFPSSDRSDRGPWSVIILTRGPDYWVRSNLVKLEAE